MRDYEIIEGLEHLREVCRDNFPCNGLEWDFEALDAAIKVLSDKSVQYKQEVDAEMKNEKIIAWLEKK